MGSPHRLLGVATPDLRRFAKAWLSANAGLAPQAILDFADTLVAGEVHEEKTLAALIIGYSRRARAAAIPSRVDGWLDGLVGWAEIDALCSNVFQAEELLDEWAVWAPWIAALASDPNSSKRRASLVLLTGPVRRSDDARLLEAAIANLDRLKGERAILITKAVSWLLRSLSARHPTVLARYLDDNHATLPAIALREATAKLETGRKTRPPQPSLSVVPPRSARQSSSLGNSAQDQLPLSLTAPNLAVHRTAHERLAMHVTFGLILHERIWRGD